MADILNSIGGALGSIYNSLPKLAEAEKVIVKEIQMIGTPPAARAFVRLAGLSGATAVALGAYGSHVFRHKDSDPQLKDVFDIANKYHFIHSLALLSVPLASRPMLTGSLMTAGLVLFCGSCYAHAFTANTSVRRVTPYGGFLLIFAWASMIL
ncbi:transmembrane protein [Plakobranchus ocellatus]|uniref:Transmembrane protein n=1 Tax=Plakobranchus ocellatus TaxID=259542 RepID=A0AAV3ZR23_9GAST|nr:transmembrane protein [Plakobranchus ocellatus]